MVVSQSSQLRGSRGRTLFGPSVLLRAMDALGILGRALSRQPYCSIVLTEGERGDEGDSGTQSALGKDSARTHIFVCLYKCTHIRRLFQSLSTVGSCKNVGSCLEKVR